MITNLPEKFKIEHLGHFNFGDPDATIDLLFKDQTCLCRTNSIIEFLNDRHSILVGERGTGKTALARMLNEKILSFPIETGASNIIIPVDQSLDYRTLKDHIIGGIYTKVQDITLKYRLVWEIFFLYKIISQIKHLANVTEPLLGGIRKFENAFDTSNDAISLIDFFISNKKKIGVKFDISALGMPSADLYLEVTPEGVGATPESHIYKTLKLRELKDSIAEFLMKQKLTIYLLVDKIDEFVIRDEYEAQRQALQGLLAVEKDYQSFRGIKLKLFIRADLFRKLDLSESGADKIATRTMELQWTGEDIRGFLAKRIFVNYLRLFKCEQLLVEGTTEFLYIDRESNLSMTEVEETKLSKKYLRLRGKFFRWIERTFPNSSVSRAIRNRKRRVNFDDSIYRDLICSFLGINVTHLRSTGSVETISSVNYLATHFCLCTGFVTPRVMLIFFMECITKAKEYYRINSDLEKKEEADFPIMRAEHVQEAYGAFRNRLWEVLAQEGKQWGTSIRLLKGMNLKGKFTAQSIADVVRFATVQEQEEFFAVLNHLGILACVNRNLPLSERVYELPIVFRGVQVDAENEGGRLRH